MNPKVTQNKNLLGNFQKKGGNPVFTDVHGAFMSGAQAHQKGGWGRRSNKSHEERLIDSKIMNDNQAIDFDYKTVPPELLPGVKDHVTLMSRLAFGKSQQFHQMDSSDATRINVDVERDAIESGIEKLANEFQTLKAIRQGWKDDTFQHSISDLVDSETKQKIHGIVNNKLPMSYTPDGRIMFGEGENAFGLDGIPPYFNKDFKSAQTMLNTYTGVFETGKKLTDDSGNLNHFGQQYYNQFQDLIKNGGDSTLLSLAFDDVGLETQDGGLLGFKEDHQSIIDAMNGEDPLLAEQAREELTRMLTEKHMQVAIEQGQKGWDANELLKNKTGGYTQYQKDTRRIKKGRQTELLDAKNQAPGGEVIGYSGSGVKAVWVDAEGDNPGGYRLHSTTNGDPHPAWGGKIYQANDPQLHQIMKIYI